jgi:hypothetical protein
MKKLIIILFVGLVAFSANAQVFDFRNPLTAGPTGPAILSDTVTNTGTAYLTTLVVSPAPAVTSTIWVAVTKISGTVGGTITLQGSLDGTNYKAAYALNTATALATFTPADASGTYHWVISGSPYRYYRVSWTGTGTMAASFTSQLFRSK